jgi:mRNA interferase MazF
LKRGEIWTVSGGAEYAGKPRPVVIVQDNAFEAMKSLTICGFTTDPTEAPLFRPVVLPHARNGLQAASRLMADKITTVPKSKFGRRIGVLDDADMSRLDRAMLVFLGLATPRRRRATAAADLGSRS